MHDLGVAKQDIDRRLAPSYSMETRPPDVANRLRHGRERLDGSCRHRDHSLRSLILARLIQRLFSPISSKGSWKPAIKSLCSAAPIRPITRTTTIRDCDCCQPVSATWLGPTLKEITWSVPVRSLDSNRLRAHEAERTVANAPGSDDPIRQVSHGRCCNAPAGSSTRRGLCSAFRISVWW